MWLVGGKGIAHFKKNVAGIAEDAERADGDVNRLYRCEFPIETG